jgi:Putative zinc-finger
MFMKCWTVQRRFSAYLDNSLPDKDALALRAHLRDCGACSQRSDGYRLTQRALRSLPYWTPPAELTMRLRIAASRELARNARWGLRFPAWASRLKLTLDNLMKPLALPAAGGLCAAILLFTILVPPFSGAFFLVSADDVPTGLSTDPVLKSMAPIGFHYGDAEVDLRIDEQGRIVNYSIVGGQGLEKDAMRRSIENNLLFTQFAPATAFGVPVTGTTRLSFRSSRIDVKG